MANYPRSERSNEKAFLRFCNMTKRPVEIIWINFTGSYVRYEVVPHGRFLDINTYKRHPWIAIDHVTKDPLHIEKTFIFYPQTTREYFQERRPDRVIPPNFETRIRVSITLPIYSLRYACLLTLRNFFQTPDNIDQLGLPNELQSDLERTIKHRNNQVVHPLVRR